MEQRADAMVLDHEAARIDGSVERLDETYAGKVVLVVNVASRCGFTRQYSGLQALFDEFADDGLVVLGFPSNEFGRQEPGSDKEIAEFCRANFGVTFPMFSKVSVKGDEAHPLFADLGGQPEPIGGEPRWNFTKFLVDHEGRVIRRFEPSDEPSGEAMRSAITDAIAAVDAG
ncbi:MAG: glutathione peroxidase [Planctomycetota bacterium]